MNWTVIIAAKDAGRTISLAVRSSLLCLGKDDEVLVLLDGCRDNSSAVMESIHDPRLSVFESKKSLGRAGARNFLISKARGKRVAILDADDVAFPWRFIVSRFLLNKNDVIFGAVAIFGDLPFRLPIFMPITTGMKSSLVNKVLTYRNPLSNSTAAFNRTVVKDFFYDDAVAEDYLLWLTLANKGYKLRRIALPLSGYRLHDSQFSQTQGYQDRIHSCTRTQAGRLLLAGKVMNAKAISSLEPSVFDQIKQLARRESPMLWFEEELPRVARRLMLRLED